MTQVSVAAGLMMNLELGLEQGTQDSLASKQANEMTSKQSARRAAFLCEPSFRWDGLTVLTETFQVTADAPRAISRASSSVRP
jgi:hypothetical protein